MSAIWFSSVHAVQVHPVGVLILPGISHEEPSVLTGIPEIGCQMAARGFLAASIDFAGDGHDIDDAIDSQFTQRWTAQIVAAIGFLRQCGATRIVILATRLAAILALKVTETEDIDAVVTWSPIFSGRRYVRELRMIASAETNAPPDSSGSLLVGTYRITVPMRREIESLELKTVQHSTAKRILYVESPDRSIDEASVKRLEALGAEVDQHVAEDTREWLSVNYLDTRAPAASARAVAEWLHRHLTSSDDQIMACRPELPKSTEFAYEGQALRETFVDVGALRLNGVITEALALTAGSSPILFLESVGPGRTFVTAARRLATQGRQVLRFDLAGHRTSPLRPDQKEIDVYGPTGLEDVRLAVEHLKTISAQPIVIVGYCARAWASLVCPPVSGVGGIAAINVYLSIGYRKSAARSPASSFNQGPLSVWFNRWVKRVRDRLDRSRFLAGPAISWIKAHRKAGVKLGFFYDSRDSCYLYWDTVIAGSFASDLAAGGIQVHKYDHLGHFAIGEPARTTMFEDITQFVQHCEQSNHVESSATDRPLTVDHDDIGSSHS